MERVVRLAVRFLDDVIEMNPYPLAEIDATVKSNRRIGLGIMGWADLLFTMGIPYDSPEAIDLADRLMAFVKEKSHDQSAKLAEERGPFPNWSLSIYQNDRPLRNSTVTTIAPTGTISMIAGCSSGIEPIFALAFEHRVRQPDGERVLTFVNETFERIAKERGFYSHALMREIAKRGSLDGIPGVPEDAARIFRTSHEINPEWHVRHQAAFQRYTDNGVSKTINLPNSASEEDVARAYLLAWELGCLGITVFRDGCKGEQVLNVGIGTKENVPSAAPAVIRPRPRSLNGTTYRTDTPIGTAWITVTETAQKEPFEVFVQVGKGGSDTMAVAEALGRLISLVLRLPSPTRKGARSASRAASTSVNPRRGASPPFRSLPPGGLRRQSRRSSAAGHGADVKFRRVCRRQLRRGRALALEFSHRARQARRSPHGGRARGERRPRGEDLRRTAPVRTRGEPPGGVRLPRGGGQPREPRVVLGARRPDAGARVGPAERPARPGDRRRRSALSAAMPGSPRGTSTGSWASPSTTSPSSSSSRAS